VKTLFVGLSVLSVTVFVAGVVVLNASKVDVPAEIGKWLLTLGTALAITGALSAAVKQRDERRSRRSAWEARLNTVIAANHAVVVIRLMLRAHKTARMYSEQIVELIRVRAQLRTLQTDGAVLMFDELHAAVKAMRRYLDSVGYEYESGYLPVARQQLIDERRLTRAVHDAAGKPTGTAHGEDLVAPVSAWALLTDPARFPRLVAFLDDESFQTSAYRTGYTEAKRLLEAQAGIIRSTRRTTTATPDA